MCASRNFVCLRNCAYIAMPLQRVVWKLEGLRKVLGLTDGTVATASIFLPEPATTVRHSSYSEFSLIMMSFFHS